MLNIVWIMFIRSMQEIQLDKHIKLLDSPGIVIDTGHSDAAVILKNCVKVRLCFPVPNCDVTALFFH